MHTQTLLIADDSITTQRVIQLTFALETIRVIVAADGHQALDRIEADRPDIILACTSVPGVDGYAIARHVSQQRHLGKVPVLLLRNGFESVDEEKVKESGACGILEKPLDPALVIQRVKQELSLQAAVVEGASGPKPRKARTASPRPRSARRVSALPAVKRPSKRAAKSTSGRRPSAPRARTVMAGGITAEMLAKDVSEAVGLAVGQAIAHAITHVIARYERAHGLAPEPAVIANIESVATSAANQLKARSAEGPVVVHGDTAVLTQLRRDMGLDDFLLDDGRFGAAVAGIPADAPADAVAFVQSAVVSSATPSFDSIRSAAVSEREPAEVLGAWAEELEWLAAEIGNVRAPETVAPEWSRDLGTSPDQLSPAALPARLAAWLEACDPRPGLASFAADTIAWLRTGTSQLSHPFRGGRLRVRTWVVSLAAGLGIL